MLNKSPAVSIVMNCHNGSRYLEDSLKSVLSQTYKNWELIFFDNFSSDNSKYIAKSFNDRRIKYFKSNKLLNLYNARNKAVEKCKGEYICFLDVDDLWTLDKLQHQIDFLQKNKIYKIVYSNYYVLKKNQRYIKFKSTLSSGSITQKLLNFYSIGILTVIIKKDIFKKFKFNKKYNIIGDFDLFIKLSQKYEIGYIQKPIAFYRLHNENFSKKISLHLKEIKQWIVLNEKKLLELKLSLRKQKIFIIKLNIKYLLQKYFGLSF